MAQRPSNSRVASAVAILSLTIGAAIGHSALVTPAHAEAAVAPEKNPPGDIPDTQVFIDYTSPAGFSMKVPEGWARSDMKDSTSFVSKLDGVVVAVTRNATAPTVETVKSAYVHELESAGRAVAIDKIENVNLPAGPAIRIAYSSNSEPNAVTSKQVRLENNRHLYFRNGTLVSVDLYAPLGADNVDQWQLMSQSFRWN